MNTPEQVTLTEIYINDKDKNGNALIGKNGKPYTRMSIRTSEHGSTWYGGYPTETSKYWKKGDKVWIIRSKNGQYDNFRAATKTDLLEARVAALEKEFASIRATVLYGGQDSTGGQIPPTNVVAQDPGVYYGPEPEEEGVKINPDDLPF